MRVRQGVHESLHRCRRPTPRERLHQYDDIDQQHAHEQLGRVLHRRRHPPPYTLDRLFDRASVFVMKGVSFRSVELEIFSGETTPKVVRTTS